MRIISPILVLSLFTVLYARGESLPIPVTPTVSEQTGPGANESSDTYGMAIGPGLSVRFLNKDWSGIEIPVSLSYRYVPNSSLRTSYTAGFGYIFPVKIIGDMHVCVVPGVTAGYSQNNTVTRIGYTLTGSGNLKFEVEYLLGRLPGILPGAISIGGSFLARVNISYTENRQVTTIHHYTYTLSWGGSLGAADSTLAGLMVRYYF